MSVISVEAQRLAFSCPLREDSIDKSVMVPKCQRSRRASEAQRISWNAMLDGDLAVTFLILSLFVRDVSADSGLIFCHSMIDFVYEFRNLFVFFVYSCCIKAMKELLSKVKKQLIRKL